MVFLAYIIIKNYLFLLFLGARLCSDIYCRLWMITYVMQQIFLYSFPNNSTFNPPCNTFTTIIFQNSLAGVCLSGTGSPAKPQCGSKLLEESRWVTKRESSLSMKMNCLFFLWPSFSSWLLKKMSGPICAVKCRGNHGDECYCSAKAIMAFPPPCASLPQAAAVQTVCNYLSGYCHATEMWKTREGQGRCVCLWACVCAKTLAQPCRLIHTLVDVTPFMVCISLK